MGDEGSWFGPKTLKNATQRSSGPYVPPICMDPPPSLFGSVGHQRMHLVSLVDWQFRGLLTVNRPRSRRCNTTGTPRRGSGLEHPDGSAKIDAMGCRQFSLDRMTEAIAGQMKARVNAVERPCDVDRIGNRSYRNSADARTRARGHSKGRRGSQWWTGLDKRQARCEPMKTATPSHQ